MRRWVTLPSLVLAVAAIAAAQTPPETFTATASVKKGALSVTAPFRASVTRYASAAERDQVIAAVREGGTVRARTVLAGFGDAGFVELGGRRTAIKFAAERPTASGRLLTILTAEPIVHLGAGVPASPPQAGFDVAVALLVLDGEGGTGELAPAAKVGLDKDGALLIQDYAGGTVVWLDALTSAR